MPQKAIGQTFAAELKNANLLGLPFSWSPAGDLTFDPSMPPDQCTAVQAVYAAHDPTRVLQRPGLQDQLTALDVSIPRGLEDYWAATSFNVSQLPAQTQAKLTAKANLRAQLAALISSGAP